MVGIEPSEQVKRIGHRQETMSKEEGKGRRVCAYKETYVNQSKIYNYKCIYIYIYIYIYI
jgi:hypothetical protein